MDLLAFGGGGGEGTGEGTDSTMYDLTYSRATRSVFNTAQYCAQIYLSISAAWLTSEFCGCT